MDIHVKNSNTNYHEFIHKFIINSSLYENRTENIHR